MYNLQLKTFFMCNCGKGRTSLKHLNTAQNYQPQTHAAPAQTKPTVIFQYTGKTALTIIGNVTKRSYRFKFSGDIQHVDSNDAMAMKAVPVLKRL
ncbi:MAG: hypothetical protein JO072_13150 [Parafilimonas sp.]|nr:hypothetical protein [Parafilimonas sp.]